MERILIEFPENMVFGDKNFDAGFAIGTQSRPFQETYTMAAVGHPGRNPKGGLRLLSRANSLPEYLANLTQPGVVLGHLIATDLRDEAHYVSEYGASYLEVVDSSRGIVAAYLDTSAPAFAGLANGSDKVRASFIYPDAKSQKDTGNYALQPQEIDVQFLCEAGTGGGGGGATQIDLSQIAAQGMSGFGERYEWSGKPLVRTKKRTVAIDANGAPVGNYAAKTVIGRALEAQLVGDGRGGKRSVMAIGRENGQVVFVPSIDVEVL